MRPACDAKISRQVSCSFFWKKKEDDSHKMSRAPGVIPFNLNFEPGSARPLDARTVVPLYSDLAIVPRPFLGLVVAVTSDPTPAQNGLFVLKQLDPQVWELVGTGGGGGSNYTSGAQTNSKVVTSVGGISANTDVSALNGLTFSALFDTMLFPTVQAVLVNPSATLAFSALSPPFVSDGANLVTIGASITGNITVTPSLGSVNSTPSYSGLAIDSGVVAGWRVNNFSGVETTLAVSGGLVSSAPISRVAVAGSMAATLTAGRFGTGPMYNVDSQSSTQAQFPTDGKFPNSNGDIVLGSVNTLELFGVYPLVRGADDATATLTVQWLVNPANNSFTVSQPFDEAAGKRHKFAVSVASLTQQSVSPSDPYNTGLVIDVWNTLSGNYDVITNVATKFLFSSVFVSVEGNNVSFVQFERTGPLSAGDPLSVPLYRVRFA